MSESAATWPSLLDCLRDHCIARAELGLLTFPSYRTWLRAAIKLLGPLDRVHRDVIRCDRVVGREWAISPRGAALLNAQFAPPERAVQAGRLRRCAQQLGVSTQKARALAVERGLPVLEAEIEALR